MDELETASKPACRTTDTSMRCSTRNDLNGGVVRAMRV